jgi:hypothetical protein
MRIFSEVCWEEQSMALDGNSSQSGSWLEQALDIIKPQPAPPPAPPEPAPPPAATPGTPQNNIIQAQDQTRTDKAFQPKFNDDGTLNKSYCNTATYAIVKAANGPTDGLEYPNGVPAVANDAARYLPLSKAWDRVQPQDAQDLANQGTVVVGVQSNPGGHGHMVTVRPEIVPGVSEMSGEAPLVNNVGRERNILPADRAFPDSSLPVRYYAPSLR